MTNDGNSPRHRIEAAKELRAVADTGPEAAPAANVEKFLIQINLGNGETFTYPNNSDATPPQKLLPIKQDDDDDGTTCERPTPPVQHTLGVSCGSVRVGTFNRQTETHPAYLARRRPTPPVQPTGGSSCADNSLQVETYRRCLAVIVKPFQQ